MDWVSELSTPEYALVVGAFLAPLFVMFTKITKGKKASDVNSTNWPFVNGVIKASTVKDQAFFADQKKLIKGWKDSKAYTPFVSYEYSYKGSKYMGSNITTDKTISTNKKLSENVVAKYPAGKSVTVYVNPKRPSQAYLEPKNMALRSWLLTGFFGVLFPAIALAVLYFSKS